MIRARDRIEIESNFHAVCRDRGKKVPGTEREGHNVFTTTGRDWIAHLLAWATIGTPDTSFTNRRVRWMGVGSGSQLEVEGVTSLDIPVLATATDYLIPIETVEFPSPGRITQIFSEFRQDQLTFPPYTVVSVSEAGMYVDVFHVSTQGGIEDSPVSAFYDTTLNPTIGSNPPIAYHAFEVINKTADFILEIRWELRV